MSVHIDCGFCGRELQDPGRPDTSGIFGRNNSRPKIDEPTWRCPDCGRVHCAKCLESKKQGVSAGKVFGQAAVAALAIPTAGLSLIASPFIGIKKKVSVCLQCGCELKKIY